MAREQLAFDYSRATSQEFARKILSELLDRRIKDEFETLSVYAQEHGHHIRQLSVTKIPTVGQARTAARLTAAWLDAPSLVATNSGISTDRDLNRSAIRVVGAAIAPLIARKLPHSDSARDTVRFLQDIDSKDEEYDNNARKAKSIPDAIKSVIHSELRNFTLYTSIEKRDKVFNKKFSQLTYSVFLADRTRIGFSVAMSVLAKTQAGQERQRSMIDAFFHDQYHKIDPTSTAGTWTVDLMSWLPWPLASSSNEHDLNCWVIDVYRRVDNEPQYVELVKQAEGLRAPADQRMTPPKRALIGDGIAPSALLDLIDAEIEFLVSQGVPADRITEVVTRAAAQTAGPPGAKQLLEGLAQAGESRDEVFDDIKPTVESCTPFERMRVLRVVRDALDDNAYHYLQDAGRS